MHPAYLVTADEFDALEYFQMFKGGGLTTGPLPFSGGFAEQPAALLAAFGEIAAAQAIVKKGV